MKGDYLVSYFFTAGCLFSSCLVQLAEVVVNLLRDSSRLMSA